MKGMSIESNEIIYEMLIEVFVKDGKLRLVYDLFLRVVNEGLNFFVEVYDDVIRFS